MLIGIGNKGDAPMNNLPAQGESNIDRHLKDVIDSLGQGILVFDWNDRLVSDNRAARAILGPNLTLIRAEGWVACAMLLDARRIEGISASEVRRTALSQDEPVRFHTLLTGAYIPCWAVRIPTDASHYYTLITLEQPDWVALREFMSTFRSEARMSVENTRGHADLIIQIMKKKPANMTVDQLASRVVGFAEVMSTNMYRLERFLDLLYRLEILRTGQLPTDVNKTRHRFNLANMVEDFLEELADQAPLDPMKAGDLRDRLSINIPASLMVSAAPDFLRNILLDLLRNAIMYSPKGTPIVLKAARLLPSDVVQIDVVDQGCGIRAKETDRVFAPFQRARQPQILAEFGYGLSLYLAKAELDAMGGRIWFESTEKAGATFSIKLPG
jgi:signal transduction histidine kinase